MRIGTIRNVQLVSKQPNEVAEFSFIATFHGEKGDVELTIPPRCLIDYAAFQEFTLRNVGELFLNAGCEGRTPDAANEAWRAVTFWLLKEQPTTPQIA